ncbi:MAG: hypothetical protein Kow0058_04340 [Roseovarius sp.]
MARPVRRPPGYDGKLERMARALGLELLRDRAALGLSEDELRRMMRHCAACGEGEDCRRRLLRPRGQALPPDYCLNRKLLLYLAARALSEE